MALEDTLVVDLVVEGSRIRPALPTDSRRTAYVVIGRQDVAPEWLEAIAAGHFRVLRAGGLGEGALRPVIRALHQHLQGVDTDWLASAVLRRGKLPASVLPIVKAVCRDPWRIRRPRDLADACRMEPSTLRGTWMAAGFRRGEHLLTVVRQCAHDALVAELGLASTVAWSVVGVSDLANFRRQADRIRPIS